jgi:predicted O-methyltransferase YrrM
MRSPIVDVVSAVARHRFTDEECKALDAVRLERTVLLGSGDHIAVQDFGAGYAPGLDRMKDGVKPHLRSIADIARRAAVPDMWGRFLFVLVRRLKSRTILELGTSLGISGAYLVAALRLNGQDPTAVPGRLVSLEGDPNLADRASQVLHRQGPGIARVVQGRFDVRLPEVVGRDGPFDLVFIDGHHEEKAVVAYFDVIRPGLRSGAVLVVDDLEPWASTVFRGWRQIVRAYPAQNVLHLGKMGLLHVQ